MGDWGEGGADIIKGWAKGEGGGHRSVNGSNGTPDILFFLLHSQLCMIVCGYLRHIITKLLIYNIILNTVPEAGSCL